MDEVKLKCRLSPSRPLARADVSDVDAAERFESVCVEMGKAFARRYRWNRAEADETVTQMIAVFGETVEELGTLIEDGEDDAIYALAKQEQTRRLIRGGVR